MKLFTAVITGIRKMLVCAFLIGRSILGWLWSGLGRALAATKPTPAMGLLQMPLGVGGLLLGPFAWLIKLGVGLALFWAAVGYIHHRGYEKGFAARDRQYIAEVNRANERVDRLNAELDAAYRALEDRHRQVAASTLPDVPSQPACLKSACALAPDVISRLNGID